MDLPSDSVPTPPWTFDASVRVAVLYQAARDALEHGDPMEAVALAEEVLEEDPNEVDALLLVAEAAPMYGHGTVGLLAVDQAERRGSGIGVLRLSALVSLGRLQAALTESERVMAGGGEAGVLAETMREKVLARLAAGSESGGTGSDGTGAG
jgi:hypothetical protein